MRELIVVREGDWTMRSLGDLATPRLLDACNDGKAHEAWQQGRAWRLRDDVYDAEHKPADVPYVRVRAGWIDR